MKHNQCGGLPFKVFKLLEISTPVFPLVDRDIPTSYVSLPKGTYMLFSTVKTVGDRSSPEGFCGNSANGFTVGGWFLGFLGFKAYDKN